MRKILILALATAAAIVPAMASAQDRGDRHNRGGDSSASQPRNNGGGRARDNGRAATPAPTPAPAPRANNDGSRYGSWAGRNAGRDGSFSAPNGNGQAQAQARAQAQAQAQAQARAQTESRSRADGRGSRNDGARYGSWAGRNAGPDGSFSTPTANDQSRSRTDRNRWNNGGNNQRGDRNGNNWRGNDGNRGGAWNRNWRGNNQYNWQSYRSSNRNAFRLPRYYAPYGWNDGYRRFGIGSMLESLLFNQSYWIDDPYDYRLPEAYGEYRWVRYYNDALLVDIYSGEVVDVVYDIFY